MEREEENLVFLMFISSIFLSLASPYLLLLFLGLGSLSVFFGEKTEENNNGGEKGRGKWGFVKGVGVLFSSVELINSIDVLENYIYAISFFLFFFIIICPSMEKTIGRTSYVSNQDNQLAGEGYDGLD